MAKYTKKQILDNLKNLAEQLGKKSLSHKDIASIIPVSTVCNYFGNCGNALEAAGLKRVVPGEHFRGRGPKLTDNDLFKALYKVECKIGREPGYGDCSANCKHSVGPFSARFGKWPDVLAYYQKWKLENDDILPSASLQDAVGGNDGDVEDDSRENAITIMPTHAVRTSKKKAPEQFYGEPIDFRGFRHAPINEQGVVFLFGMVGRELGFHIEAIQQGFPDCEGKYLYDSKKNLWARARIEFEYKASNFLQHGHDLKKCDFIVCWLNDWPDCPVNVIELKTEILKLSSR